MDFYQIKQGIRLTYLTETIFLKNQNQTVVVETKVEAESNEDYLEIQDSLDYPKGWKTKKGNSKHQLRNVYEGIQLIDFHIR